MTRSWKGVNEEMQTWQVPAPHTAQVFYVPRGEQDSRRLILWRPGRGWVDREGPPLSCSRPQLLLSRFLLQDLSYLLTRGGGGGRVALSQEKGILPQPSGMWREPGPGGTEKTWDAQRSLMNRVQFISWMMVAVSLKCDNSAISTQSLFTYKTHHRPSTV